MKTSKLPFESISVKDLEEHILRNGCITSFIDVCGFFLCKKGFAKVILNEKVYVINEGDVYLYTPSTFVNLLEKSDVLEGLVIKSSLDVVLPFVEKSVNTLDIMMLREKPCFSLDELQLKRIEGLTYLLEQKKKQLEQSDKDNRGTSILKQQIMSLTETVFYELLYDYFCSQTMDPVVQSRHDKVFQLFILSLMRNYKKEREVAYYAQEQCLSPRYFSSIIKETSGHTASEWIVEMVISYARQLLLYSDKSIKEIALEFNFSSISFFGKYFKQYTGLSPKSFRAEKRK